MARLLIYDAYENKVYTYTNLNENDPMPYSTLTTLRLREFRGKSSSPTLWTTIAAMEAWNLTRRKYGRGIPVGYAFRPWLPDRQPHRRYLWCPHRAGAARLPKTHQPAGGRRVRLQQLEKNLHRRHRHRAHQNHH